MYQKREKASVTATAATVSATKIRRGRPNFENLSARDCRDFGNILHLLLRFRRRYYPFISRFGPRAGLVTLRQTFVRRCQNCVAWAAVITRRARPARLRPVWQ